MYALESLYEHQDFDWVVDTIPHVLAWVHGGDELREPQPLVFKLNVARASDARPEEMEIAIRWSVDALEQRDGALHDKVTRLRTGRSVDRERLTETAAYGLALVAISLLMPGRRVTGMSRWDPPDFLFDATPGALRGVEVAGRTSGGPSALRAIRVAKREQVAARSDILEVHLSLWCADPRVSELYRVKP